jgi:hypothetical protein
MDAHFMRHKQADVKYILLCVFGAQTLRNQYETQND